MTRARSIADIGDDVAAGGSLVTTESPSLGRRNLIINGAMQVAQRGTSFSNIASDTYVADRWYVPHSSVTPDISQQSVTIGGETGLPTQLTTYARVDANVSGANNLGVVTRLEDVRNYTGTHTLSFYAKGSNPTGGVFGCRFIQRFSVGGSSQVITDAADTFAVTSTWQRFEISIDLPSVAGKTIPTPSSSYVQIQITQPNSDAGTGTWTLDITGVQLEVGSVATPFEHRSYGEELAACQRYYYKQQPPSGHYFGVGNIDGSSGSQIRLFFPVEMRTSPTSVETTGTAGNYQLRVNGNLTCTSVPSFISASPWDSTISFNKTSHGLTNGYCGFGRSAGSEAYLAWSAEL